jgi:hypothetical protein
MEATRIQGTSPLRNGKQARREDRLKRLRYVRTTDSRISAAPIRGQSAKGESMSDRIFSYTVTLDGTYKDEDARQIQNAIEMVKGVSRVVPQVANAETYFAIDKARIDLGQKILDVIYPKES